jgi:hypothetical protein
MIKLINILKELNIQQKQPIGKGDEGEVYDLQTSSDKIVKIYTSEYINPKDKETQYKIMSENPKFFVKIYKYTPKYVIMEKIKTPVPNIDKLQKFINDEVGINFVRGGKYPQDTSASALHNVYSQDVVSGIYKEIKDRKINESSLYMFILKKIKELGQKDLEVLLLNIFNFINGFYKTLLDLNSYSLDIHRNNLGVDKQGNLKLFDIGYDSDSNY